MSAYARHPHHRSLTPPSSSHQPFVQPHHQQDRSALDLLSRVALEQCPSTPPPQPHPSSPPPSTQSLWHPQQPQQQQYTPTPQPLHPTEPLPKLSFPTQLPQLSYAPRYEKTRPVYSSDFSPVSSEDGSSSRPARPPLHLPQRLNKIMRVSKEQTIVKTRTQPSRFCHICSRTSKKVGLVACGNFATGACRKVVCQKCFNDHDWDWKEALKMGSKWICTHCRQACPDRAQCAIYKRTNERRREQQQRQRVVIRSESAGAIRGGHGRFINKTLD